MKIAILGTRGIPNYHGGFEQFAESLSEFLVEQGHNVTVYNSHMHPYKQETWKGVKIVHIYDPEYKMGTVGQFFYDLKAILHSRKQNFDIILQLGYTSSSIWSRFFPKRSIVITNMDGLEWKRSKYKRVVQKFLKYAEALAVKHSDFLVSDSLGIKEYLKKTYGCNSKYIAYGAKRFDTVELSILDEYNLKKREYNMLIARLEPENNIETILDGVAISGDNMMFLVIGKHKTKYGEYLKNKYKNQKNIVFLGGIYNQKHLNNIRRFSNLYFHGHSVGGTNPSLLEAMASSALIIANDNIFNRSILEDSAFYFKNKQDIKKYLKINREDYKSFIDKNLNKISEQFSNEMINKQYETYFLQCLS